ncbi:hypothetical protein Ais01nite_11010 [Asanoa ishikariensis]|uniref:Uncharacterized protein n=1 Tax=Asanoa ishikariensis TaxID=137265 RepID=A0A1H3T336_9ACTN|nr:hypothetical protein [Asanoa ishikariensis]GIF63066.1 hypothetical protein Ais01nite_11010 [Asanoa ishikariensis]SDZ44614.1 hypothetical protein SAMN05421684_5127 [Asanoa ishikariensis]
MATTNRWRIGALLAILLVGVAVLVPSAAVADGIGARGSCIPNGQYPWTTGYENGDQMIPYGDEDPTNSIGNWYVATSNCRDINMRVTSWGAGVTIGAKVCTLYGGGSCQPNWTYFGVGSTGWKVLAYGVPDTEMFYIQMYGTGYTSTGFVAF